MLKIHNLSFAYHQKDLLKNIHLELKNQAFIGILGPNGSGKSTLLKLILKNLSPNKGVISLFNTNIKDFSLKEFAKNLWLCASKIRIKHPFKSHRCAFNE